MSTKEIELLFQALDLNKDGYVDFPEFCNLMEDKRQKVINPESANTGDEASTEYNDIKSVDEVR